MRRPWFRFLYRCIHLPPSSHYTRPERKKEASLRMLLFVFSKNEWEDYSSS